MKESLLVKLALATSLAGLLILFFISGRLDVEEKPFDTITVENLEEYVKIKGQVTGITHTENAVFLKVTQPQEMDIVVFKDTPLNLSEGSYIEIIGKVDEYENKPEILAELIRVT